MTVKCDYSLEVWLYHKKKGEKNEGRGLPLQINWQSKGGRRHRASLLVSGGRKLEAFCLDSISKAEGGAPLRGWSQMPAKGKAVMSP